MSHADTITAFLRLGPASAAELAARLGLSQPTISRALRRTPNALTLRQGRQVLYGLPHSEFDEPIPVYQLGDADQPPRHLADLLGVAPDHWWLDSRSDVVTSGLHDDLPWWMYDLRPAGFLGRQLPNHHPTLEVPSDIRLWSTEHLLRYLLPHGSDTVGAWVLGQRGLMDALARRLDPVDGLTRDERADAYVARASDTLQLGAAGSAAAGEQPKFLALREDTPVLVKFSPPTGQSVVAARRADLLVVEHLALETLRDHGRSAAASELVLAGDRVFLEVERFDRRGPHGRVAQVSLLAVDAAHIGRARRWTDSAVALGRLGVLSAKDVQEVRWLERFGELTANTDRHFGNLSVLLDGERVLGLCPAYDVAPMRYAPRGGELPSLTPPELVPTPDDAAIATDVAEAASDLWQRVLKDDRVSAAFKAIVPAELAVVRRWLALSAWLV